MKECVMCKTYIQLNQFRFMGNRFYSYCFSCERKYNKEYRQSINGLIYKMYSSQTKRSKDRNNPPPEYTKNEFKDWILGQYHFELLYDNWVTSGHKKDLTPSCDRLNDNKPYTFDNIRLVTWEINNKKGNYDRKHGVNNKVSKKVVGIHIKTNKIIEFHSIREAERQTGIQSSHISKCCLNKKYRSANGKYYPRKSAGNYKWKYKD